VNARWIYRRLYRNRVNAIWGHRALLTVRLPLTIFPTPPPPRPVSQVLEDGKLVVKDVFPVCCGGDPRLDKDREREPLFVREKGSNFEWYEGFEFTHEGEDETTEILSQREMSEDEIRPFVEFSRWSDTFLYEYGHNEVYDAFLAARELAATHYYDFTSDSYIMTYSVKTHYRSRMRWFCAELARALKVAKAHGVPVKVFK